MCGWGAAGVGKASLHFKDTQRPLPPSPKGSFGAGVGERVEHCWGDTTDIHHFEDVSVKVTVTQVLAAIWDQFGLCPKHPVTQEG